MDISYYIWSLVLANVIPGYPGYGFGYGARPYGAGAWNYGLPQFVPAAAPEAAPTSEAAPAPAAEE